MLRNTAGWLLVMVLIAAAMLGAGVPVAAQGEHPTTTYRMNLRTGPGTSYDVLTALPGATPVALEARSADHDWVLGHTLDGAHRGWLAAVYLAFPDGFNAFELPVSEEIVGAPAAPAPDNSAPDAPADSPPVAEGEAAARTVQTLNVRGGPSTGYSVLGQARAGTALVVEGRNANGSWVLAHTADNRLRGWLYAPYLTFTAGSANSVPVSEELFEAPLAAGVEVPAVNPASIPLGTFNAARVQNIDLGAYPPVGRATSRARTIFLDGQRRGNNRSVVSKVGDCSTAHWYFLTPFASGEYDLAAYGNLQGAVNHFGPSLANASQSSHDGFNANAVIAPEWANPAFCRAGESPLTCEFRINKPSVAIIMFGTSDLLVMTASQFDYYMRWMVQQTIDAGVIPILSTFPGNQAFWDRTIFYNQIVVRIALDYNIPLINLWLALEALPNHGLEPDGFHLGEPPYGTSCLLTEPYLSAGYTTRNLVTMQTLDNVWRGAMQ